MQGVTVPHRQNDRDDRVCSEDHFLWRNMYSETCRLCVMRRWRCSTVRVGIEYRQLYTYHFIEKGMLFTIRIQTVGPVPHYMFDIVAATIGQQGRATGPPRPIHCCCCPKEKNQGASNQALRIATTEWELTAQIIISSAYINWWSVGSRVRGARTLIHAHNSGTTCLRVYVPSQKNDPLCMAYHPYHFVGEVLLHPVYHGRLARWIMWRACDVGEAKEGL